MSKSETKAWLIAYDISQPRRLRQVHRLMREEGIPVQYSAFILTASDRQLDHLLADLRELIDPTCDDVRAYHIPQRCAVWSLGRNSLPSGILLDAAIAAKFLLETEAPEHTEISVA
ncbi:CRISPR-associated endonuclease Cas2 [Niveibacterium sp. 24ML]|uniref:CRISPR-associated endonuclease Cas2 n=1 Tax=Niveibacterium sp. 24ML TaxID=2985512 RepID=UPI00227064BB|nr:CRISPR-associated endonuclease Cas2 [Niveibacterium sp. 24ML]MCX9157924.1 CRISPR-associated endonuclease Cas2 [Niveibacterium sp. 24ML]